MKDEAETGDETVIESDIEKDLDADKAAPDAEKKEGTPDKALQRVQQDQAAMMRLLEKLNDKKDAGETLTPKEQRKLDKVREFVKGGGNILDEDAGRHVSEAIIETADDTEALKAEHAAMKKRLEALEGTQSWAEARVKFAGVDTDAVWKKAWDDASEVAGEKADREVVRRFASQMFRERCEAAKKRMDGAKPDKGKDKSGEAATYKVGTGQRPAPIMSEEDEALAEARSLVRIT